MSGLHEAYRLRSPSSQALHQRAEKMIPGGVSHSIRYFPPYPFYVRSARGSRIWDVDGNEYVDYWIGHLALILGHNHPVVLEAMRQQLEEGVHWGTANEGEVELAELVHRTVPCAEAVKFSNTGAEATMYAARVARGCTGRSVILKAEGGWHGFCTDLLVGVHGPFQKPESLGLPKNLDSTVGTFPFNDSEAASEAIRKEEDLAGVIVEPVLGAGGGIAADREFLQTLREETEARDALLIFDEIITGFRLALGGGQEYYRIKPDLAALGKVLGGGLPIGAVVGTREAMELTNPRRGDRGDLRVSIGGGTFSCNPLTMAAGKATVGYLEQHRETFDRLGRLGEDIRMKLANPFLDRGLMTTCTGLGSIFQLHFLKEEGVTIRNAADVYDLTDHRRREEELKLRLVNHGVYTMHGGLGVSVAHTEDDVAHLLDSADVVAEEMRRGSD